MEEGPGHDRTERTDLTLRHPVDPDLVRMRGHREARVHEAPARRGVVRCAAGVGRRRIELDGPSVPAPARARCDPARDRRGAVHPDGLARPCLHRQSLVRRNDHRLVVGPGAQHDRRAGDGLHDRPAQRLQRRGGRPRGGVVACRGDDDRAGRHRVLREPDGSAGRRGTTTSGRWWRRVAHADEVAHPLPTRRRIRGFQGAPVTRTDHQGVAAGEHLDEWGGRWRGRDARRGIDRADDVAKQIPSARRSGRLQQAPVAGSHRDRLAAREGLGPVGGRSAAREQQRRNDSRQQGQEENDDVRRARTRSWAHLPFAPMRWPPVAVTAARGPWCPRRCRTAPSGRQRSAAIAGPFRPPCP